jgi:hypothetical protein
VGQSGDHGISNGTFGAKTIAGRVHLVKEGRDSMTLRCKACFKRHIRYESRTRNFINHALSPEFKLEHEPGHDLLLFVAKFNITGATGTATAGLIVFAPCFDTYLFALEQTAARPPSEGAGGRLSGLSGLLDSSGDRTSTRPRELSD